MLYAWEPTVELMATTDNKVIFKTNQDAPPPAPEAAPEEAAAGISSDLANRYGMRPSAPAASAARPAAPAADLAAANPTSGEGTWERDGSKYSLKITDLHGKEHVHPATRRRGTRRA